MNTKNEVKNPFNLKFNRKPSTVMHVDLNSCFATIEQQANPYFRGKPLAVAAYTTPSGCILAASIEAKRMGVQTGMRVKDGQKLCPNLLIKAPDPSKYRFVHQELKKLLLEYTDKVVPKSIDEFVLDFEGAPAYLNGMLNLGREIKKRIKETVGEWLTVSVGIGPNRFLAKTAANLHKPDGLDEIDVHNFEKIYKTLTLSDLTGIALKNTARLNRAGIFSVWQMYNANLSQLKIAFESINAYYWMLRLKGWEIDDISFDTKSFGNSYALPKPLKTSEELSPLLSKLTHKMSQRLRKGGYYARGVHLAIMYRDFSHWHKGLKTNSTLFDTRDIYRYIVKLLMQCPYQKAVRELAVSVYDLERAENLQLDLFTPLLKNEGLVKACDQVNFKYGDYVITPARMMGTADSVPDRIAFGAIKELIF